MNETASETTTETKQDEPKRRSGRGKHKPFRFPDAFTVKVTVSERPAADIPVQVIVPSRRGNDYTSIPVLTSADGTATFEGAHLAADIRASVQLFPKQFTPLSRSGKLPIRIVALGKKDIAWAERAHDLLADKTAYPEDYRDRLTKASKALERIGENEIAISLTEDPDREDILCESLIRFRPAPSYEETHYMFATDGKRPD